jgi:hypothetical protein
VGLSHDGPKGVESRSVEGIEMRGILHAGQFNKGGFD